MADDQTDQTDETTGDEETTEGPNADDIKKMQAALRKANKEAETYRLKVKEFEDSTKTETEKLNERTRELEGNLTAAEQRAMRLEIALDKGMPKALASRLQGGTREEMEADADELMSTLGDRTKTPTPSFDGGAKDREAPTGGSFLTEAIRNARR